jgi:hypothetical protein
MNFSDPTGLTRFEASSNGFAGGEGGGGYMSPEDPDNDDPTGLADRTKAQVNAWIAQEAAEQQAKSGSTGYVGDGIVDASAGETPRDEVSENYGKNQDAAKTNGKSDDVSADNQLAGLFTNGGIVRGAGSIRNEAGRDTHYQLADGTVHTFHIYGDSTAASRTGVYVPASFSQIEWVGKSTVVATNPTTGEVLQFYHILRAGHEAPNKAGSTYIGQTGGAGGNGTNDVHAHVTLFRNRASRDFVHSWVHEPVAKGGFTRDISASVSQHVRDIRTLLKN